LSSYFEVYIGVMNLQPLDRGPLRSIPWGLARRLNTKSPLSTWLGGSSYMPFIQLQWMLVRLGSCHALYWIIPVYPQCVTKHLKNMTDINWRTVWKLFKEFELHNNSLAERRRQNQLLLWRQRTRYTCRPKNWRVLSQYSVMTLTCYYD